MDAELSLGVASCGRPRILNRCIQSVLKNTEAPIEIIILDNVRAFTKNKYARVRPNYPCEVINVYEKKIGCCESNNILADACKTKYFMHMDDDLFIPRSSFGIIDEMLDLIKKQDKPTIIGGCWDDTYYGQMRQSKMLYKEEDGKIWKEPQPFEPFDGLIKTDECLHAMIMDKEAIYSQVRWDEHFKWKGDRFDFFLQCKEKDIDLYSYYGNKPFIHDPKPFRFGSISYEDFGGKEAMKYFEKKWGKKPLVWWDQKQTKPGND